MVGQNADPFPADANVGSDALAGVSGGSPFDGDPLAVDLAATSSAAASVGLGPRSHLDPDGRPASARLRTGVLQRLGSMQYLTSVTSVSTWSGRVRRERVLVQEPDAFDAVTVERGDSLATIDAKIDAAHGTRIALFISHGNDELASAVGIRRLMRHGTLSGKQVIVVTRNLAIRRHSHDHGQAVATSLKRVRFDRRPGAVRIGLLTLQYPEIGTLIRTLGLAVGLTTALLALFWFLPEASVTLYPPSTAISKTQALVFDSQATRASVSGFIVPAVRRQVDIVRTIYVPATGQADGDGSATATVSDADITFARGIAPDAVLEQGTGELRTRYGANEVIFPESAQTQVLGVDSQQNVGDPARFVEVTIRGSVSMLTAQNSDIRLLLLALLHSQVPGNQMLIDSSLRSSPAAPGNYDKDADRLTEQMEAEASVTHPIDLRSLQRTIAGKGKRDAQSLLANAVPSAQPPTVELSPGWVPWIPRFTQHITFRLQVPLQAR